MLTATEAASSNAAHYLSIRSPLRSLPGSWPRHARASGRCAQRPRGRPPGRRGCGCSWSARSRWPRNVPTERR